MNWCRAPEPTPDENNFDAEFSEEEEAAADELSDWWFWGHSDSTVHPPPDVPSAKLFFATLPLKFHSDAFYAEFAQHILCPHYLDKKVQGTPAGSACPFAGGVAFTRHADIKKKLAEVPEQLVSGEATRRNELANLKLDPKVFPLTDIILLCGNVEMHRRLSPHIRALLNNPSMPDRDGWKKEAEAFLATCALKRRFKAKEEVGTWWFQMMWKYIIGITLTVAEAQEFGKFQSAWLASALTSAPNTFVDKLHLDNVTSDIWPLDKLLEVQVQYRKKIRAKLPDNVPEGDRDIVAQGILEVFSFGGISVPPTIHAAMAVLFRRDILLSPVEINEGNIEAFIYEVTRLFPTVQGFCYYKGNERQHLELAHGLRDPAVWGPDSHKFTLKDLDLYKKNHIGFANGAVAKSVNDTKECPGQHIALPASQGFILALAQWQPSKGKQLAYWAPKSVPRPGAVFNNWWMDFDVVIQDWMDGDQTGESLLAELGPIEMARLLQHIGHAHHKHSKLRALLGPSRDAEQNRYLGACNLATKMFFEITRGQYQELAMNHTSHEIDMTPPRKTDRYFELDFFGKTPTIRLPTQDGVAYRLRDEIMAKMRIVQGTEIDDSMDPSVRVTTKEDRLGAIMLVQQAYRRSGGKEPPPNSISRPDSYLPKAMSTFYDITTDDAQVAIAKCGMGQLYLKANKNEYLKAFGDVICDTGVLATLSVRPSFERLGAIAVFKRESNDKWTLTAIDWKHGDKVVRPGDHDWEHAKWAWRCSILTLLTAVNHLVQAHWIVANSLNVHSRENLGVHHPIRRLLQVVTYNTTTVNHASSLTLYPNGAMLTRLSPFPYEELQKAFVLGAESWKFQSLPEEYATVDLPEDIKSKLPFWQDGLEVYEAMRKFVEGYVDVYYPTDESLRACPELTKYWQFEHVQQYARQMPAISKEALVKQIARGMFDVTAYHEYVGYVVTYTTDPAGAVPQVRPGRNMTDIQEMLGVNGLVAGTGIPMPMFVPSGTAGDEEWLPILDITAGGQDPSKFKKVTDLYHTFMAKLKHISAEIAKRNAPGAGREMPFRNMDPVTFERSVSL